MIYIVHGDDIVASRERVSELTSECDSVVHIDAEKATSADLVQALSTNDMFQDKKCIVVEKVLKLPKKEIEKLMEANETLDSSVTLILWHNAELSKVFLGKFKKAHAEVFMLPKIFFTFLDSLSPTSAIKEIELLAKMQNVEAEQIFYAMIKRIRHLLMVKRNNSSEELSKMSPWQIGKIQTQSRMWNVGQLEKMYKSLFDLEIKMKSGGLMLPLRSHLDILLVGALH